MNFRGIELPPAYYQDEWVYIIHGDCREILPSIPDKSIDLVLTDPPYDNYYTELYTQTSIELLNVIHARQFVFWSARSKFPLEYTAMHVWDKQIGTGTQYEMIYELNGKSEYRVFTYYRMNNALNARWVNDVYTAHPSQKPQRLIAYLISEYSGNNNLILDPFLGSGTTAYCAKKLNRYCIGIEIEEKYCEIAAKRCCQSVMELNV